MRIDMVVATDAHGSDQASGRRRSERRPHTAVLPWMVLDGSGEGGARPVLFGDRDAAMVRAAILVGRGASVTLVGPLSGDDD